MEQRYVSSELVHFVGRDLASDAARYRLLVDILRTGHLAAAPVLSREGEAAASSAVCFADVPVSDLPLHMAKYHRFGLSFRRATLAERGANPVFYVCRGTPVPDELARTGFVKYFDPALADDAPANYYMEREWRVLGDLAFTLEEVRRVVLPEAFAGALRKDVPEYVGQVSFSESPAGY